MKANVFLMSFYLYLYIFIYIIIVSLKTLLSNLNDNSAASFRKSLRSFSFWWENF